MSNPEKLIIIGSGPAGHTAAIYAARANLNPLMFEGFSAGGLPGGQLMNTTEIENFPGFAQSISGPEFMMKMREQSISFGSRLITQDVDKVNLLKSPFSIFSQGQEYLTKTLIIATGATARYLNIPSEQRLLNKCVSACATCDGALPMFRNQPIVVIGGGDSAMEEAMFLTKFASKVYLVHRRKQFRASKIMLQRLQQHPKVQFLTPCTTQQILGTDYVTGIQLYNTDTQKTFNIDAAGVFLAIGRIPNTSIFKGQLDLDEQGYIKTQAPRTYTNIPGVFACGDVQDHIYRQAITSAGSGCKAAIDCERWILNNKE